MRLDVTVRDDGQADEMREAAKSRADIEVHFFLAPESPDYMLPFPVVSLMVGDREFRQHGNAGIQFFRRILSGEFSAPVVSMES